MKSYLLVYDTAFGSRDEVKALLNIPEVTHWRYDMPNCFYLVSALSAEELVDGLRKRNGDKGKFLISEISGNVQGYLTPASWYLINNKKYQPKKD